MSHNVEEFLDDLLQEGTTLAEIRHAYDPGKAHDYYLRTRKLKGRHKGTPQASSGRSSAERAATAKRIKAARDARIFALRVRLQKLEDVIDQLNRAAKERSGVDTNSKSGSGSSTKDRKPLSATEKREAAQKQKERREKEEKLPAEKALEAKIKRAKERIEDLKVRIAIESRKTGAKNKQDGR